MVLLQHRLNVKLSQRQILTPGLVQMVSVLALNKLELKDMINAEMVENPVLEELEDAVPLLDDVGRQEEERDRQAALASGTEENPIAAVEKKDPFEEIDFGSFFQDYLDPGYRSSGEMEEIEKPSFENFLSKPGNLTDHLLWQLGAISVRPPVHEAAELIIGNLNEEGYLIASDEELLGSHAGCGPRKWTPKRRPRSWVRRRHLGIDAVAVEQESHGSKRGWRRKRTLRMRFASDLIASLSEARPAHPRQPPSRSRPLMAPLSSLRLSRKLRWQHQGARLRGPRLRCPPSVSVWRICTKRWKSFASSILRA